MQDTDRPQPRSKPNRKSRSAALLISLGLSLSMPLLVGLDMRSIAQAQEQINEEQLTEADRLFQQGVEQTQQGQFQDALQTLQQVLEMRRQAGDRLSEADTISTIADIYQKQQQYQQALEQYQQALAIVREIGDRSREANILYAMGGIYSALQQYPQALEAYQQTLVIVREIGYSPGEANALSSIGDTYSALQQYPQALEVYQQAFVIARDAKDRLREALTLQSLGTTYQLLQQYPQALERFQQALVIAREIESRPLEFQSLQGIGTTYASLQQYSQSIEANLQALSLFEDFRNLFESDPSFAGNLNIIVLDVSRGSIYTIIGQSYSLLGRYSESQDYLTKAIELLQKTLIDARANNNHEMESSIVEFLLTSYSTIGTNYMTQGQYQQAIAPFQQALELAQQTGNQEQEENLLDALLANYAVQSVAYATEQNYEGALNTYQQILEIAQENNVQHWQARALLSIGQTYSLSQNFAQALNYYQQALPIAEQIDDHSLQVQLVFGRGAIYQKLLRYSEALEDLQDVYSRLQAVGDSIGAAGVLNAIGDIYATQNQYEQALNAYQEANDALQNNPFTQFERGINADNVEAFCAVAEQFGPIEGFFAAGDICESAYPLGAEALKQPFVLDWLNSTREALNGTFLGLKGGSLHSMGQLYLRQGSYSEALVAYQQALPLVREARSPIEGAILGDMGIAYLLQGQYDQALNFSQQAVEISRSFNHRINEEDALYYLAIVYWAQGNIPAALDTLSQKAQVENENLANNLTIGSEERKQTFISGQTNSTDITVTLHLQSAPQSSEAARLAFTTVLQRKGRILDAVSDNIQRLRQNLQPEDQALFDEMNILRAELGNLFSDQQNSLSEEEFKTRVATLQAEIDEQENTLAQRSTLFRTEVQPITSEAVQASIPADAALIELVRYSPFNPEANITTSKAWGTPHYAAAILTPQGAPQWIDLGEAEPIDRLVNQFRDSLQTEDPDIKEIARELDAKVMQPVRSLLGDSKHVLLSPDSQLNLIPFAALVDENNQYLVENYTITYLTSGRDLLRLQNDVPSRQPPVLLANPDYDHPGNPDSAPIATLPQSPPITQVSAARSSNQRSVDLTTLEFDPLPGTETEQQSIAPLLSNVTVLTGAQATENVIKQLQAPSILHIATHGFFLQDVDCLPSPSSRGGDGTVTIQLLDGAAPCVPTPQNTENPLMRSGLALAGFNPRQSGDEDGVLTAAEVTGLDLYGTKLVVLSACETGLGNVANGEGVYGLRRSFVMAGAESQLMSLWKVDDTGTSNLMSLYYQKLQSGMGRSEALHQVQRELLQTGDYQHPYFWASFIFSGDWSAIEGFVAS